MNKSTLLFDLDGTLFNSIPFILESFQKTFRDLKQDYPGDEAIKKYIGSHLESILANFLESKIVPLATETYRKYYIEIQSRGLIPLFKDVKATLKYLKSQNYTLGVVTTKLRKFTLPLLKQPQIDIFFDVILGAENTEKHKPHPEPLYKALEILNKKSAETVYVGDALIDLQAAQSAQIDFIAITTGTTTSKTFQENQQNLILENLGALKNFF